MALEKKPSVRMNHGMCSGVPVMKRYINTVASPASTVRIRCKSKKRRIKLNAHIPTM
ncbi:hypothetical protein D3C73_1566050 [compost metagenome]